MRWFRRKPKPRQCGAYFVNEFSDEVNPGITCTEPEDHPGDHISYWPGTGLGDDKTWQWKRRRSFYYLPPPIPPCVCGEYPHDKECPAHGI